MDNKLTAKTTDVKSVVFYSFSPHSLQIAL